MREFPSETVPASAKRGLHRHLYVQVVSPLPRAWCWALRPATGAAMQPLGDAFIKLVKMVIARSFS
jgi:aerobic C4-dicarboxylate transport protein